MDNSIVMGVDIGGSHITAALINLKTRSLIGDSMARESVNAQGTSEEIFSTWVRVIKIARSKYLNSSEKIGIAMPGPFDYEAGVSLMKNQNKYDAFYNLNIKSILAEKLDIEVRHLLFMNDAECYLRGEAFGGAAKGMDNVIGLTLGTGLGSARFYNGVSEDADLWNSSFLDGIAEDYLSARWFIKRFYELSGKEINEVKDLVEPNSSNDSIKEQIFGEFGQNLADFLREYIANEQPESVVIGGNISNSFDLFSKSLIKGLENLSFKTKIQKATLGEEAALMGAASCWYERKSQQVNLI
jgi:glucokinase